MTEKSYPHLIPHVKSIAALLKNLGVVGHINIQRRPNTDQSRPSYRDGQVPHIIVNLFNQDDANLLKLSYNEYPYPYVIIAVVKKDGT
jgi:hypothetical protein